MIRGRFVVSLLAGVILALGLATPALAAGGGNSGSAKLCQKGGYVHLHDAFTGLAFTNEGACVSYGAHGNAYSTLTAGTDVYFCGGQCWGNVSGSGLKPNAEVDFYGTVDGNNLGLFGTSTTDANGSFSGDLFLSCGSNWTNVYAVATTWAGATITSNVVSTPCG